MTPRIAIGAALIALVAGCTQDVSEERLDEYAARVDDAETMIEAHVAEFYECDFPFAVDVLEYRLDQEYPMADAELLDTIDAIAECKLDEDEEALLQDAEQSADAMHLYVRSHTHQHSHHSALDQCEKDEDELTERIQAEIAAMRHVEEQLRETLRCRE